MANTAAKKTKKQNEALLRRALYMLIAFGVCLSNFIEYNLQ